MGTCRQQCLGGESRQRDAPVSQQGAQTGESYTLSLSLCHDVPSALLDARAKAQAVTPLVPLCGCWLVCSERRAGGRVVPVPQQSPQAGMAWEGCPAHWQGARVGTLQVPHRRCWLGCPSAPAGCSVRTDWCPGEDTRVKMNQCLGGGELGRDVPAPQQEHPGRDAPVPRRGRRCRDAPVPRRGCRLG